MDKKICFILDHYEKKTSRHFGYIYDFIQELGSKYRVYLVVERCFGERPSFRNLEGTYVQKVKLPVIRRVELLLLILYFRLAGCKIFYSHYSYYGAILGGMVSKISGSRSFFWHCIVIEKFIENVHKSFVSKFIFQRRLSLACKLSNLVVGSEVISEHYKKVLGERILKPVILPNWTDLEMFDPARFDRERLRREFGYKKGERVIFFLHGMEAGKGPQFLPRIVKEIASAREDVKFLLTGEGSLREEIERGIEKMGYSPFVCFSGEVLHEDIPRYFAVADIFIMPSLFEAFSRCLLEAMAMGLPFVATDGGCGGTYAYTPEEQHQFIVPTDRMEDFPALVLKLLDDEELRRKLSFVNREFVKEYAFDKALRRFEDVIVG